MVMFRLLMLACCAGIISCASLIDRVRRQAENDDLCAQADIVLVLDSSGSIGKDNWLKVLEFAKGIVDAFPVGDLGIRLGVISYGTTAKRNFHLNTYNSSELLKQAIDGIPWMDEATNTSGGVRMMYRDLFTLANGDRPNIPNIGIVMTDGESNRDQNLTVPESDIARTKGITMFALGIGSQVNQEELNGIGNRAVKNLSYVFNAESFDALEAISTQLVSATCDVLAACNVDSDIVFIFDSSGSVGSANYAALKEFIANVIEDINIGDDLSHVALISYSDTARVEFSLADGVESRGSVRRLMMSSAYTAGTTNTANALNLARTVVFGGPGDRSDFRNVIVLVTDGSSNDYAETLREAMAARLAGINVIVVGVGKWLNMMELRDIASDPDEFNVIIAEDFADLAPLKSTLKRVVCDSFDSCLTAPCENGGTCESMINSYMCVCPDNTAGQHCQIACPDRSDVVIALDSSSSMSGDKFYKVQQFAKLLAMSLPYDADRHTRVAVERFSSVVETDFLLNQYSTKSEVMQGMTMPFMAGTTDAAQALNTMENTMFSESNGDRADAKNVAVFVTDGHSNDRMATYKAAVSLREAGVTVLGVGIDIRAYYDLREMTGIVSDPDNLNFWNVPLESLSNITDSIVEAICNDEDNCADNPCGAGQCQDLINDYRCQCPEGTTGINCERGCDGQLDIVFMLDTSGSIRRPRFQILKDLVKQYVRSMEIGSDRTRVGVLTFANDAIVQFHLGDYFSREDVIQTIEMIDYTGGRTNTADALQTIRQVMFTLANGDREDVPNIAVLITDGQSTVNPEDTLPEAIEARVAGIHLMVVAVEVEASDLEMKGIASDPDVENLLAVDSFSQLPGVLDQLVAASCDDEDECASNPCQNGGQCFNGLQQYVCMCDDQFAGLSCERECTSRQDVAFLLDTSGSMDASLDLQQRLAKRIVSGFNFQGGRTRVAMVTWSDSAEVRFHLNAYPDQMSVMNAIAFTNVPGRTNTQDALTMAVQDVFTTSNGDRAGDANIVVVMTDGNSNINSENTIPAAEELHNQGVRVISVGVGERVNMGELTQIASDPVSSNSFVMNSEAEIDSVAEAILDSICSS